MAKKIKKRCRKCWWYSNFTETCDYFMLTWQHKTGTDETCDSFKPNDIKEKQANWLYERRM